MEYIIMNNLITVVEWKQATSEQKEKILKRSQLDLEPARAVARDWISKIAQRGDEALLEYIRQFDDPEFTLDRLRVTKDDIAAAYAQVSANTVAMIHKQIEISKEFHARQLPTQWQETA